MLYRTIALLALGGVLAGVPAIAAAEPDDWHFLAPFARHRARIGIQVQPMTPELREHFQAPADRGLLVTRAKESLPAARAGVEVGDVITSADRKPMQKTLDLARAVGRVPRGDRLELEIVRDGKERVVVVEPEGDATPWIDPDYWHEWAERGMLYGSRELRRRLEDLEERLRELEKQFRERQEGGAGGQQT
jgi:C-terminal processing protease CtpA/Prc